MLGFPASTEFGKRIPKQKFYENLEVSPALRRVFVDQIRLVYWRNKLAASTLNIAAGEAVTEIEVFEVRLNDPQRDEKKKQLEKQIATLKSKMQREKQLNRQMEMNAKLKKLRIELKQIT